MTNLYAHRGASMVCPENTMAAFRQALHENAYGIELDVQLSKDGEMIVIHDPTIERTTNGTGAVKDLTVSELKHFDAGSWFNEAFSGETIPLLEEVLVWMKETQLVLNIELKIYHPDTGIEQAILDIIHRHQLKDRIVLSSFNLDALKKCRKLDDSISLALLISENATDAVKKSHSIGAEAIHAPPDFMFTAEAARAKADGLPIRLYTVNDLDVLNDIALPEVESLITDAPAKLRSALATELAERS